MSSKFWQILNEHFQNGQNVLTLCQSGEILPKLVTLVLVHKGTNLREHSLTLRGTNQREHSLFCKGQIKEYIYLGSTTKLFFSIYLCYLSYYLALWTPFIFTTKMFLLVKPFKLL